jgi:hypothetical protein
MMKLLAPIAFVLLAARPTLGTDRALQVAHRADVIVVGEVVTPVVRSGQASDFIQAWSGIALFHQDVRYRVVRIIRGSVEEGEIVVSHPLVYGSRSADRREARLNPTKFREGARLILFLQRGQCSEPAAGSSPQGDYCAADADYSAIQSSPAALKRLRRLPAPAIEPRDGAGARP